MPGPKRGPQLSSTARGLGYDHVQIRRALLHLHVDGAPCPCLQLNDCGPGCPCRRAGHGLPMYRDARRNVDQRPLEADHTQPRARGGKRADRLVLARCNRSRKDGRRSPHQQRERIDTDRDW